MLSPFWIFLATVFYLETGIVIAFNAYIVMVNGKRVKSGLRANPSHMIQLTMALVNIILQCFLVVQGSIYILCVSILFIKEVYTSSSLITLTMVYCSFWLTAWLCVHYCSSIINIRFGLCVWLKKMNVTFQIILILVITSGSFLISFLSVSNIKVEVTMQHSDNSTLTGEFISGTFNFNIFYAFIANALGIFLPFLLILCSVLLTFCSLIRHVCRIKQNDSGFAQPKLQAHINAIRTIVLILILFLIFLIVQIVVFTTKFSSTANDIMQLIWIVLMFCPLAESIIIVQANPTTWKTFVEKLKLCKC